MSTFVVCHQLGAEPKASFARRALFLAYGSVGYALFLAVYLYAIGFVTGMFVPRSIDGPVTAGGPAALGINLVLLVAFGLQHSIMARPTFKRWWLRIVPEPIERSTYVLMTNVALIALFALWRPMPALVWDVQIPAARAALWVLCAAGWALVVFATFLLNHFDLFGLRQVWLYFRGRPYTRLPFSVPFLYRHARHPLYVGWLTAFWVTPTMTFGHLLFASVLTAYILIAIRFEERNLLEVHGEDYARYRRSVPMLALGRRRSREAIAE